MVFIPVIESELFFMSIKSIFICTTMYHQNYLFSEFNFYLLFVLLIFVTESAMRFMTSTCILSYLANTCEMITQIKIEVYTKKFRISLNLAIINF